jgi:hypothetical protein
MLLVSSLLTSHYNATKVVARHISFSRRCSLQQQQKNAQGKPFHRVLPVDASSKGFVFNAIFFTGQFF